MANYQTTVTLAAPPVGNVLLPNGSTVVTYNVDVGAQAAVAALMSGYVPQVPSVGSYTYDASGRVTGDPDGNVYTYNGDDTVNTITKNGVTRTASYGANGIASWA